MPTTQQPVGKQTYLTLLSSQVSSPVPLMHNAKPLTVLNEQKGPNSLALLIDRSRGGKVVKLRCFWLELLDLLKEDLALT